MPKPLNYDLLLIILIKLSFCKKSKVKIMIIDVRIFIEIFLTLLENKKIDIKTIG